MATKKYLVDLEVEGDITTENLGVGAIDSQNLVNIEGTNTNYDISRALEIDYTKSHSTTGWGASAFGVRVNVFADGTGQNADLQGGSFSAKHIGSGVTYYLLGSQSNAKHEGSGNTGAIWGAFNQGAISGSGTGTHPFLIGTNQKADLNNANASVGKMQAIVAYAKTSAGDITERVVAAELGLDCNQGAATAVDASVLYLTANVSNLTVSGNARTIESVSTLPSVFAGTMETTSFIKTNGRAIEYLMADGTVKEEANIYSVSSIAAMVALTTKQGDIVVRTDESKTYMDNGGELLGSELLSYGDFSSVAYPWNYGTWSYIPTPTVSGGIATLTIDGGSFPTVNPRIEQQFVTTSGEDYTISVTGDGNGNDIQILAVDPNNSYAFMGAFDITSNGTYTTGTMTVTATSAAIVIQVLVKGSDGDIAYLSAATAKEVDATAKYTHFASI